jgi:hypothetical protein
MRSVSLVLALLALNASLTFTNIWPTLAVRLTPDLSVEVAILVLAMVLARRWIGNLSAATLRWLAILWVMLILGRYVDVTVRSLYGREINLYWDLRFAPDVGAMFAFVAKRWQIGAFAVGMLLVPFLIYIPVRWSLRRVSDAVNHPRARLVLGTAAAAALLLSIAPSLSARAPTVVRFAEPVTPAYVRALTELAYEMTGAGVKALGPPPSIHSSL